MPFVNVSAARKDLNEGAVGTFKSDERRSYCHKELNGGSDPKRQRVKNSHPPREDNDHHDKGEFCEEYAFAGSVELACFRPTGLRRLKANIEYCIPKRKESNKCVPLTNADVLKPQNVQSDRAEHH